LSGHVSLLVGVIVHQLAGDIVMYNTAIHKDFATAVRWIGLSL
jgi:hypothetical protein